MLLLISQQSIHYDMEDLIEQANEIQETMGRTYGVPDEVDEADLEAGACLRSEARTASRSSVLSIYRTRGVGYGSSGGGGDAILPEGHNRPSRLCGRSTGRCRDSELGTALVNVDTDFSLAAEHSASRSRSMIRPRHLVCSC